jgi:hypothetical protein
MYDVQTIIMAVFTGEDPWGEEAGGPLINDRMI